MILLLRWNKLNWNEMVEGKEERGRKKKRIGLWERWEKIMGNWIEEKWDDIFGRYLGDSDIGMNWIELNWGEKIKKLERKGKREKKRKWNEWEERGMELR